MLNLLDKLFLFLLFTLCCGLDPYFELNVQPSDSPKQIKNAYKKLAKEW